MAYLVRVEAKNQEGRSAARVVKELDSSVLLDPWLVRRAVIKKIQGSVRLDVGFSTLKRAGCWAPRERCHTSDVSDFEWRMNKPSKWRPRGELTKAF